MTEEQPISKLGLMRERTLVIDQAPTFWTCHHLVGGSSVTSTKPGAVAVGWRYEGLALPHLDLCLVDLVLVLVTLECCFDKLGTHGGSRPAVVLSQGHDVGVDVAGEDLDAIEVGRHGWLGAVGG